MRSLRFVNSRTLLLAASRLTTTTHTGAVLVPAAEPEFEGETAIPSPQVEGEQNATEAANVNASTVKPEAAAPTKDQTHAANLPLFDASKLTMGLQRRPRASDVDEIRKVHDAYLEFFNHIRFRNGWALPPFEEKDVTSIFREAADVVVRIRKHLDECNPTTKLRRLDGEAQTFLHSKGAQDVFSSKPREFFVKLVHATFQDACGYVEGLTKDKLDTFLAEILEYQYNPRVHAMHQVTWLEKTIRRVPLDVEKHHNSSHPVTWTKEDTLTRTDSFYCQGHNEEKEWREVIAKLYAAMDAVEDLSSKRGGGGKRGPQRT